MTRYADQYELVSRQLSRLELMQQSGESSELTELDLINVGPPRFLDFYGDKGVLEGLEEYGFLAALRTKGFDNFTIRFKQDDRRHTLIVEAEPMMSAVPLRIIELAAHRADLKPEPDFSEILEEQYNILYVDWTLMQNPFMPFTIERPRLPGQDAPGLGVGEQFVELIARITERLDFDAWVNVPAYFHNAALYSRELFYFDPDAQGRFEALATCLLKDEGLSLAEASWAVEWQLVTENDRPFKWMGEAQVWPRASSLMAWFVCPRYRDELASARNDNLFALDREAFDARWASEAGFLVGHIAEI